MKQHEPISVEVARIFFSGGLNAEDRISRTHNRQPTQTNPAVKHHIRRWAETGTPEFVGGEGRKWILCQHHKFLDQGSLFVSNGHCERDKQLLRELCAQKDISCNGLNGRKA